MNRRQFGRALTTALGSIAGLAAGTARGGSLSKDEEAALERGEVVRRPLDFEMEEGLMQGGLSYAIVDAPAPFVLSMLADVSVFKDILALTLEAKAVGQRGDDTLVFFKHGGDLGTASYTMRVRPADATGTIRFWMDPSFDHEIDDIWGYVRATPIGPDRCLATYAVLCDVGTIFRLLFGERIREYALDTPGNIRFVAGSRYLKR